MNCACQIAESNDNHPLRLNPCPEHERWAKAIRAAERERLIAIVDEMMGSHNLTKRFRERVESRQ